MKKEIQIKSKVKIIKNYILSNIFFRFFKLLLNPLKFFRKIKNFSNEKKSVVKINWKLRADKHGKYSVIDTRTPKEEFDFVTNLQKKIMFLNLRKYLSGKEKKVLDFGCGAGRFSEELTKINNQASVLAIDTEKKLIDIAKRKKRVNFMHIRRLDQIHSSFDLIFIANVLGGIEKNELYKIKNFFIRKLNKGGILFLTEHVSKSKIIKKEILKEWSNRNDEFYLTLFRKISLKKIDEYKYLQNDTSIYIGKK